MDSTPRGGTRIRFDSFEADLRTQELRLDGRALRLPNQSFLVLAALLESPGELVTRDTLRQRLWPKEQFVDTEQSLNAAVNRLREALRDSAEHPKYVETLPRRGYRFIGTVQACDDSALDPQLQPVVRVDRSSSARGRRLLSISILLALALLGFGFWALRNTRGAMELQEARILPFTSLPRQERAPAFSPEGRHIAFAWNGASPDGFDLYVKQGEAETPLRLTHQPAQWISPSWSPDGSSIAFARASDTSGGIYLLPAPLGGSERRLVNDSFSPSPLTQVSWFPDGQRLVYSAFGPNGTLALYEVSIDAPNPHSLELDVDCRDVGSPAVSPDGERIAFVCTSAFGVYSIQTTGPNGGPCIEIARIIGTPKGLAWASDGESLVFANDTGDGGGLWAVSLQGKLARIPFGEEAAMPSVDPSSGRIAYARVREQIDIWRVDLASSSPQHEATRLVSSTRIQMNPQYSPDGSRIAFQSTRSGSSEIWVAQSDGSNPVRISSFNGPLAGAPSWCSDGKRLAFDSRASGVSALYVADIEERRPRQVQSSVENLALPTWSSDCRWLLASDGYSALYILPSEGGEASRFTTQRSYYARVTGDDAIFNVKETAGVSLWRKRIGEAKEQRLEGMPLLSYQDGWAVASSGIYFTRASQAASKVWFYDFATRSTKPVAELKEAPAPAGGLGLSVSSDERWLLYTQTEAHEGDIMVLTGR
jgi:Tol biopolymer transport system component/DNA-binding winged helix-turn-helix (wHTH) protein